jgi:chromosome segregation ATPase
MDFLFDIYQQGKITEAQQQAEKAANKADRFADEIKSLERRLDRLTLATQALWEMLRDAGHHSEGELVAKMQDIVLRDGSVDGKISRTTKVCSRCGRNSNSKRLECLYCGEPLGNPNLFDAR